jgi:hypothetical protein
MEMIKSVTTAEENWKKFQTWAYFLSKETNKEGVHVIADDYGRTMIRSTNDKPLSQEVKAMFYDFLRKQQ